MKKDRYPTRIEVRNRKNCEMFLNGAMMNAITPVGGYARCRNSLTDPMRAAQMSVLEFQTVQSQGVRYD